MGRAFDIFGDKLYYKYSEDDDLTFQEQSDYTPIIESFGKIEIRVDQNDYQGDSFVYYRDGNSHGILIFGWGSCSGCDALQGCGNESELDELIESMEKDIRWFTAQELYEWLNDEDYHETQYHSHIDEWPIFRDGVSTLLAQYIVEETLIKNE